MSEVGLGLGLASGIVGVRERLPGCVLGLSVQVSRLALGQGPGLWPWICPGGRVLVFGL